MWLLIHAWGAVVYERHPTSSSQSIRPYSIHNWCMYDCFSNSTETYAIVYNTLVTLLVLISEYSGRTRTMPCLLMLWLLASPVYQQSWCTSKESFFPWWTISATCVVSARGMVEDEIDPPVSISKMIQHLNANNMKFDRSINLITIKSLI